MWRVCNQRTLRTPVLVEGGCGPCGPRQSPDLLRTVVVQEFRASPPVGVGPEHRSLIEKF